MASVTYGSQPFAEQVAFFRRKLNLNTQSWTDIYTTDHDFSFVVAGANRDEIVADFRAAVDKAISQGTTLAEFRKDFDTIVAKHGWSYKGTRGWRSRVIYDTNLRTSYAAGRYAQMQAMAADRPYWEFHHTPVRFPRELHVEWDGLILRADDPWWNTHYPPNGWGCQCVVYTHSAGDLRRMGRAGPDTAPETKYRTVKIGANGPHPRTVTVPEGVDPGFEYTPGKARMESATPSPLGSGELPPTVDHGTPTTEPDLLEPRAMSRSRILPTGRPLESYVQSFLAEFGVETPDKFGFWRDQTGEYLTISDALFRDASGELKVAKRGREPYVLMLADTIKSPDEIRAVWSEIGGKTVLRRRYIARWMIDGEIEPALAVFETGDMGWEGITAFAPLPLNYAQRIFAAGELLWSRKK